MAELVCESQSLEQTLEFGRAFASCLRFRDVVALIGDLGAGKTHLVQAIASSLGADLSEVNSPTFVLIQEYDADIPILHIDAYRLRDTDEFLELGADELLGGENVCLIEWADRVADVLPRHRIEIRIDSTGATCRKLTVSGDAGRLRKIHGRLSPEMNSEFIDG